MYYTLLLWMCLPQQVHSWTATVSLDDIIDLPGTLSGTLTESLQLASHTFSDLAIQGQGHYVVKVTLQSEPADYTLIVRQVLEVVPQGHADPLLGLTYVYNTTVALTYDHQYKLVSGREELFAAAVLNRIQSLTKDVVMEDMLITRGMIPCNTASMKLNSKYLFHISLSKKYVI